MKQIKKCAVIMSNLQMEYTIKSARQFSFNITVNDKLVYEAANWYINQRCLIFKLPLTVYMKPLKTYTGTVSV